MASVDPGRITAIGPKAEVRIGAKRSFKPLPLADAQRRVKSRWKIGSCAKS